MWFAVHGGVGRIDANGAYQLSSTAPYQPGTASYPSNLAYGPQGALWFIDDERSALVRVAVDGNLFPPPPPPPAPPAPASPAPPPAKPRAPFAKVKGRQVRLKAVEKRRALVLTCAMKGAGRCAVRVAIKAKDARRLHLKVGKKANLLALGSGATHFKKAGARKVVVKLKPKVLRALTHLRGRIRLILTITSSAPGATARRAAEELVLRR